MKIYAGVLAVFLAHEALAAMPPYFESARIIKRILDNQTVAGKIGHDRVITSIKATGSGYRVATVDGCGVDVTVVYILNPRDTQGENLFFLKVGDYTCPED